MDDMDEDLARAIALSIEDVRGEVKKPEIIELDSSEDEEDEDPTYAAQIKQAMAESLASSSKSVNEPSTMQPAAPVSSLTSKFLSERAQMEIERRERQKRLRNQPSSEDLRVDDDEDDEEMEPPAKRQHLSSSSGVRTNTQKPRHPRAGPSGTDMATIDQVFWNGECRQTATRYADPRKDGMNTFRLTEVLGQKSDLAFAIMSSYSLDFPWIYEFFDRSVPVIMIAQPDATGNAGIKNVLPNWIKTTPYLRAGYGCQHMKFMLLFYKNGRLRVVVSTANLIAYDWRDMENTVWLQDIPLRPSPILKDSKAEDFPSIFQRTLDSLNVRPALTAMMKDNHPDLPIKSIDDLRRLWDWSNVKVHLVPSVAGKHEGWPSVIRTGHPMLMTAVRKMGMRIGTGRGLKELHLECQGSSLGSYTTQWINEFHWSARGESAEDWLDESKKRREKVPYPPVKVIFPTKKTVQESALGEQGGGTIFCRRSQWVAKNFPRGQFYDSKSKGGPVLMHSKMILATVQNHPPSLLKGNSNRRGSETEDDTDDDIEVVTPAIGWAYVGSHNFTPSAWGTLSGSSFNPILNITNYELGVMFPLKDQKDVDRVACWQRPPKKYLGADEPWMQEESVHHRQ